MIWTTRPRSEGAGALAYVEQGSGPALVLIHGVGLRAEAWNGVMPHLSQRFRVIAVDMPGHGQSPLQGCDDLAGFVARLSAFVEALEGTVALAGHSMGALLAVELAAALPQKVRAAAAMNTVYRRSEEAARAVQVRAEALAEGRAEDPGPTLARWFGDAPTGAEAAAAEACRDWLNGADPRGYGAAYRIFARQDGPSEAALGRLTCPALFLTGASDPNSTPAMSQSLAARTQGSCHVLPGAAHMMPMTHAREVAAHLSNHFEAATGPETHIDP